MPATARSHFDDDIARAWAIYGLALTTNAQDAPLAADLGRVAVAFGVGAMDAYHCDAFSDTLARCLRNCRLHGGALPAGYRTLELPIGPMMTEYEVRPNWGFRMAARTLMERDNLLKLGRLKELFNPALPAGHQLWSDLAQHFADLDRKRLTGIKKSEYRTLTGRGKVEGPKKVSAAVLRRMGEIVQRRHDVVHNCDRPKTAKQRMTLSMAKKMLTDVEDFVRLLDDHLEAHRLF